MNNISKNTITEKEFFEKTIKNDSSKTYMKLKTAKIIMWIAPLIHLFALIPFLFLVLISYLNTNTPIEEKFSKLGFALSLTYAIVAGAVNILAFIYYLRKFKSAKSLRWNGIIILIISTFLWTISLYYWTADVRLLFYPLMTFVIWIMEIVAGISFINLCVNLPKRI